MSDLSALTGAIGFLNASKNILETMIGLRDSAVFQEKRLELQSKIMDAQGAVFAANDERAALIERVSKLEKQIAEMETWETEKQRYELKNTSHYGGFAYALKPSMAFGEPIHYICANCYQNNKKRFLQGTQNMVSGRRAFECAECHAKVPIEGQSFNAR